MQLLVPSLAHLDAYADALQRGWSPDNVRLEEAAREELARIADDPAAFVARLDDREAKSGPVSLPDG
ncbi:MAG TPA: GNAT family N-acetyltransferase, partial [Reyranella sp.]